MLLGSIIFPPSLAVRAVDTYDAKGATINIDLLVVVVRTYVQPFDVAVVRARFIICPFSGFLLSSSSYSSHDRRTNEQSAWVW